MVRISPVSSKHHLPVPSRSKLKIFTSPAGFGLGALNEADEDDLDVYEAAGATSGRNRMAYDIAHGDDEDRIHVGGSKPKVSSSSSFPVYGCTNDPQRPAASTSSQYLRDGKPVLAGFSLSDKPVAEDRW